MKLMQNIESRQQLLDMQKYASVYVSHKDKLFPLMEEAVGEPLPPDLSHSEAVELYIDLLSYPSFKENVDQIVSPYQNAIDPITAISEGVGKIADTIGRIVGGRQQQKLLEQQAELEEERFFQQLILNKQGGADSGKILLVSGLAVAAVGVVIYLIVKR